jgi:hypothetical protein
MTAWASASRSNGCGFVIPFPFQVAQMLASGGQMKTIALPAPVAAVETVGGIVVHHLGNYFECLGQGVSHWSNLLIEPHRTAGGLS